MSVPEQPLDEVQAANELKVRELAQRGMSPTVLALGELQVRVMTLIEFTVGPNPRFEMEFEQALGQVLDLLLLDDRT
jgi:hypothetical protein